jgi:hypothetical protein
MWYIYREHYSVIKKEWNSVICNIMDETTDDYSKWYKPDMERQVMYFLTSI